jgi:hypothetical protein
LLLVLAASLQLNTNYLHPSDYIADAMFQGLAYYTMSAISNDPFKLARMAGYYKGVQSAGSAVSFGMDAVKVTYSLKPDFSLTFH